jgi:hypothetical protein
MATSNGSYGKANMTGYEHWEPLARKIVAGLAVKPGIHIVDKTIAAGFVAGSLWGAEKRGEISLPKTSRS